MNEETLLRIKERINQFNNVVRPVSEIWTQPHLATISVILQNMGHSGKGCQNYNFQIEIDQLKKYLSILKSFSKYYDSHFENWVYSEVDMIITGESYAEDLD